MPNHYFLPTQQNEKNFLAQVPPRQAPPGSPFVQQQPGNVLMGTAQQFAPPPPPNASGTPPPAPPPAANTGSLPSYSYTPPVTDVPGAGTPQNVQPGQMLQGTLNEGVGGPGMIPANQIQDVPSGYVEDPRQQEVLRAAQERVLQGQQSQILPQTEALTSQLLADPSRGFERQQYVQAGQDALAQSLADQFEQFRQATAPISNTGVNIEDLGRLGLDIAQQRALGNRQIAEEARQMELGDIRQAIEQGRLTSEQGRKGFQTDVGALSDIIGAGEGEANREFQAAENATNRGVEIAKQFNDINAQNALAEFDAKTKTGQIMLSQDFESVQNNLDRMLSSAMQSNSIVAARELQEMKNVYDAYQQAEGRKLQREIADMTSKDARWLAEYNNNFDMAKTRYLTEAEAQMQATELTHLKAEADLNRQLDREGLSLEERALIEQARQYDSKEEFDRWAVLTGVNSEIRDRAWQTSERAQDRAHDAQMAYTKNQFDMAGLTWATVVDSMSSMEPEQAAEWLKAEALKHNIVIPDISLDVQAKADARDLREKLKTGETLTDEDRAILPTIANSYPDISKLPIGGKIWEWSRSGRNAWRFTPEVKTWVDNNMNSIVKGSDGTLYKVTGKYNPPKDRSGAGQYAHIELTDVATGATVKLGGGTGGTTTWDKMFGGIPRYTDE